MTTAPYPNAHARWLHLSAHHAFPELNKTTKEAIEAKIEHEVPPGRYRAEDGTTVRVLGIVWNAPGFPQNPMVVMEVAGTLTVRSLYTGPTSFLHPEGPRFTYLDPGEPSLRVA